MDEDYLQYGDIVHITSETNHSLNEKTFLIDYIDSKIIKVVNSIERHVINLEDNGTFSDKSITRVIKISSSSDKGFALQNRLVIGKLVEIVFNFDFPNIIGVITNLENDRIEIELQDKEIIYIDFEYKGLPSFVKNITVRGVPKNNVSSNDSTQKNVLFPKLDGIENNDEIDHILDRTEVNNALKTMYLSSNELVFSDDVEKIIVRIEKEERFQKHSIQAQITDIVDTLLSTIPNNQRTDGVLGEVHHIVERYTQLRNMFSKTDDYGTVVCPSLFGKNNKPMATILNHNSNLKKPKWILPVISSQRKLYTTPQKMDEEIVQNQDNLNIENISNPLNSQYELQRKYYRGTNTKYSYVEHMNDMNDLMIPYINEDDDNTILCDQEVFNDQETIVFNAMTWNKDKIWSANNNFIQKVITSGNYTENEKMRIKSIIMLPDVVVEFSKLTLNNATIMSRSSMDKSYVSLFNILNKFSRKNSSINKRVIDVYDEINYDTNKIGQMCLADRPRTKHLSEQQFNEQNLKRKEQKLDTSDFLKYATNYVMDPNSSINDDIERYDKFLYTIIPSTYDLLKLGSNNKNMTKNYSFLEFVNKFLEPYMIYSKHIHYDEGYAFIRFAIKKAIEAYKVKVLVDGKKSRRKILELKKKNVIVFNKTLIDEIISTNKKIYDKSYIGNELEIFSQSSTTERLSNMYDVDGTNMMSNIVCSKNHHLVINPSFVEDVLDSVKTSNDTCLRNFITKKYSSLTELEKDNGDRVLYYDDEFDDTPYEILKNYKKEQNMENFTDFLKKKLIEKHSCPVAASTELAETLVQGKKRVMNDEYAVLQNDDMQVFYKRNGTSHKWVIDRSVKPSVFINNNDLFCNINNKCVKNEKSKTCDGFTEHKNVYISEFKSRLDNLDNRLVIDNEKNSQKLYDFITRNNTLKYIQSHRQNFVSIELSKHIANDETTKSPHISLRDNILSHQNFPEKQEYIILFSEQYTRKPIITDLLKFEEPMEKDIESPYWLYCTKSNTKLLPLFLLDLANAFKNGSYQEKLTQICGEFGNTDGQGTYFDKNSGYTITKMNLVNNEEYDENGFHISSHSIIDNIEENTTNNFFHKSTNSIDIIFQAICAKLDIQYKVPEFHDFIMKNATAMIDMIEDEESYKKKLNIMKKRDTKILELPYDVFLNQNLIYIITSLTFILIQTSIPSIKKVKTFEECVKSFSGFPLTSVEEDESGIKYLSCVILKLKGSMTPWDGILNIKENVFKENLKRKLIVLLLRKDIKELYEKKLFFENEKNGQTKESTTNNIVQWINVLPPLIQFTVKKNLVNITREFHNELIKLIKTGHEEQHKYIGIIRSKMITYGYAIIESINDIVKSKDFTLKTSSNTPYRQNSCCNEKKDTSTLHYFIKEDNDILSYIDNSEKCELILSDIRNLSTAPLFFYEKNTKYKPIRNQSFSLQYRDNVIEAFIYYLKYDTNHPIPSIFNKNYVKPEKYSSKMTLDQKIEILEADKSNYDINALDNLLRTVNSKKMSNVTHIVNNESIYDEIDNFKKFVSLKLENVIVENIVKGSVTDVLHNFSTTNINDFKMYIVNVNETIMEKILQDVADLLNYNEHEFVLWAENLKNMTLLSSWNIYKENKTLHINTILNFVKNVIYKMCKVYPSIINNNIIAHPEIEKRWGLSAKHLNDLNNFKTKNLFKFLNKHHTDNDDKQIFSGDLKENEDIIELCNNIPHANKDDTYICEKLLTYSWLSVFRVFIDSTTNMNINNDFVDGDKNFFKKRMIQILTTFIEMESNNKKHIDMSMAQIENSSFKYRQLEKKMITDTLKELNSDGRKLMSQMKKIGLGIWREGKIGLVKYDPKAYDKNGIQSTDTGIMEEQDDEGVETTGQSDDTDEQNGYDSGDGDGNDDNDDDNDM